MGVAGVAFCRVDYLPWHAVEFSLHRPALPFPVGRGQPGDAVLRSFLRKAA
jgi:hypothetical protein